jgi:hypothetical protein
MILKGMEYKCSKGHVWEAAVGAVWLVMPWCPVCEKENDGERLPAVASKGIWLTDTDILKMLKGKT